MRSLDTRHLERAETPGLTMGAAHPAGVAADWLVSAWGQNAGYQSTAPAAAAIADSYQEVISADYVVESARGEMLGGLTPTAYDRVRDLKEVAVVSRIRYGHWKEDGGTRALTAIDPATITAQALALLDDFELDRPVRLLGVRLELEMPC